MNKVLGALLFILVLVWLVGGSFVFVVNETQQAIITEFGKPVGAPVTEAGIHFKKPIIHDIQYFDRRHMEWNGESKQVPTRDKRFIWVDTYGRWRIVDPLLFYQRLKNEQGAQSRLDDIIDGATRDLIAQHDLIELVRTSNREPEVKVEDETNDLLADDNKDQPVSGVLQPIRVGRSKIEEMILAKVQERIADLGIEVLDVRFKRIDYNEDVRRAIYERMIAEQQQIAQRYRSEGLGDSAKIRGEKEFELNRIRSEAERTAEEIRGEADAKATAIYADAFSKNPEFYQFLRTMEALPLTADENTTFILTTGSDFFKPLRQGVEQKSR